MKKIISLLLIAVMCISFASCGKTSNTDGYTSEVYTYDTPVETEAVTFEEYVPDEYKSNGTGTFPKVKITVKNYGEINLILNDEEAPITVKNFVKLVKEGFYDGLTFHRIIQGFMIQGGDPQGTGMGGSDEEIKGEFTENGVANKISHVRGTISMARSNDPNSASSQFFICDEDSPFLDGSYAAFGVVTSGMDVVDAIAKDAKPTDSNGTIPANEQPVIEKIEILK